MSDKFWQLNEDPMYDEDGVLIDEDADWEDSDLDMDELGVDIPVHTD